VRVETTTLTRPNPGGTGFWSCDCWGRWAAATPGVDGLAGSGQWPMECGEIRGAA
jgi:hypothetical protein